MKKKLIPKTIGNRKRDCAWGCARGINTTWENLQIAKHKSGRRSFRSPDWLVLFDLQIFSGGVYPPSATSRTISFSIFNSFWYKYKVSCEMQPSDEHTIKSCVKATAYLQFFNFFIGCNFYLRATYWYALFSVCKTHERSLARCDTNSKSKTWLCECHKTVSKCKPFWNIKSSRLLPHLGKIGPPFSSHGFYLSAAYVQLQFGESAASIWVWPLIKCSFYTRLHTPLYIRFHIPNILEQTQRNSLLDAWLSARSNAAKA